MNNIPSISRDSTKIFFDSQYLGDTPERLVKSFIKKLYKCLKRKQILNLLFVTKLLKCPFIKTRKVKPLY